MKSDKGGAPVQFFSAIKKTFQCDILCVSERLATVEAKFAITLQALPSVQTINSVCSLVPARDSLVLTLKNDSDNIVVITNKQTQEPNFAALTDDLAQDDNIDVSIRIDKQLLEMNFLYMIFSLLLKTS
jgi:hypothetical protein